MAVSMMHNSRTSNSSGSSFHPTVTRQNTMSSHDGSRSMRASKRYSVTALYLSMNANHRDLEIEDDLARAQKALRDLKSNISSQSKKNFVLEKDVRYLDSRIALLVQNRMALEEQNEVASHLDDSADLSEGSFPNDDKTQKYGNLLFLLQTEPKHIAHLCRLVTMAEIDALLQTVMFTLYGNQYESREEHLLLTMFQSVLTYQFDTTSDYSSLLRANTPVSRMMTTYTRRGPGQSYLKTVLANRINSLIEIRDLDLEINPLKVYETMVSKIEASGEPLPPGLTRGVTAEQASENESVQKIIAPRLDMLVEIANSFLDTIIDGLEETPYGIRWICKQIRSLTRRKYPDASEQSVCTLIGGFFFLRFINPAIVTPRSYMLIEQIPADNPKRTLTYVAKMLQNLANKPSYAKEPYMVKLQPFIESNKERINKFMMDLCEVQDFYETLEMDNYVALSKRDLELSITLNEIYATHSLLDKHAAELTKGEGNHLSQLLGELGPAPGQLPRRENRSITLPLYSKWETPIDDLTAALDITQEEVFFMEAKATFVTILRTLPANSPITRRPLRLDRVAEAAGTTKNDSVMVRKGIRAMELLNQLQEIGILDKEDQYALLRDEIEQELVHLGSLKEKVLTETGKLEEVFKTIQEHNNYLNSQLETYKSYLHNVRGQSEGSASKRTAQNQKVLGPYKFTHQDLERQGVIQKSNVPENRRANIYFNITSPSPGTFVISLHYKGRNRGLLELDLKLDDLLEMQKEGQEDLDLEYVQFNVTKVLALLNKRFARKRGWNIGRSHSIRSAKRSDTGGSTSSSKPHFSLASLRGTREPELSKRLYRLIKSENHAISAYENASKEGASIAGQLSEWGESTNDEALSDVSDKLGVLLAEIAEQEDLFAQGLEDSRSVLKQIRNTESSVQPSRTHKQKIQDEIQKLKYKEPESTKLVTLEQELVRAEAQSLVAEAQLTNITRQKFKEAYDIHTASVIERAEKQILLATQARQLINLLDDTPIVPGEERPPYNQAELARQTLNDAEDGLRNWQPRHGGIAMQSGKLGSNAMPGQAGDVGQETNAATGTANVLPPENDLLSEQQRVEAMERAQEEASSTAPYSNVTNSTRSESPVQKPSVV